MSTFGTITSGLDGTRPDFNPNVYLGETSVYQIPHPNAANVATVGFQVSASDEKSAANIIENQLVGISRGHLNRDSLGNSFVTFDGVVQDKSNHPENNLIISVSGVEAYIDNVYVGAKINEFSWSGLSHSGTNFLWLSSVEDPVNKAGRRSSKSFRDFETLSTTSSTPPNDHSVLAAAFTSGLSINVNPLEKIQFVTVATHVNDETNPHGPKLFQDDIQVSGITVLNRYQWDESTSGSLITSGFNPQNLTYLQNVTQFGIMTVSGITLNIHSGSVTGTFFDNLQDLTINKARIGTLCVTSGLSVSGSIFRDNIDVADGKTVDGLDFKEMPPLVSQTCLSGNPPPHIHSFSA